jgi:purine-binding chemotaxis protein CheW
MTIESDSSYDIHAVLGKMRDEYWQGLADEETVSEELLECLVFRLGGERYAFETQYACEVIRIPRLVRVPQVQELIAGIFNLRGEITAAVDVRPMLGLKQPELVAGARVIVVRSDAFATGILAEAALGVQGLSFENFEPCLHGSAGGGQQYVRGHFNDEEGAIVLLDLQALLSSPEMVVGEA